MSTPKGFRFRTACYTLEGLNSFGTVLYFNYLYFYLRDRFGFDDKHNLAVAALFGFIYIFCAWQGGRFAQRRGYFTALKTGFCIMILGVTAGSLLNFAAAQVACAVVTTFGMCFIWPTLEALVSDGETAARLPHAVGLYNVVWASTAAFSYFIGGTLIESFGYKVIFWLPLCVLAVQLTLTFWLQRHAEEIAHAIVQQPVTAPPPEPLRPQPAKAKAFLRMAWLANPFAYIGINTLIAFVPGMAAHFHLSPMFAGFACSLWYFARVAAFFVLWYWTGWHYRFRWLVASFAMLGISFATILMAPNLFVLIAAQIFFGWSIGLIYYSSLFYSMDASDTKGDHGGIHEAAIGLGNCVGPAVAAGSLEFFPQYEHSGVVAVSALLLCGLGGLVAIWKTAK